ncbi:filamentous hemagglutinin N-terminal domain-containing protein [Pseudanabaena sp. BC1403]|uniref:two-partner secretion domain-containing protein n=1 Tax=Pseudanabaena sp. BC1403 TaxID=2043171 RepID=UPI000CD8F925|nr:filamentous hemagglutinin N-terminal domain-containing protein [Pseudanabaena sp. BC1403]
MSVVVKSNFMQIRRAAIALLLMQPFVIGSAAFAQSIVPTQGSGNLGTQVAPDITNAQQLNITGGTQAAANLYHSFQQFGLTQGEIANFMSNPSVQNILARVSGGNASVINGLIQVTGGNSNLYLLNPAGIIFGANSSLNVPAAFTATTASGIQVGNSWFGVNTGIDDVKKLTGTPQAFGFASSNSMPTSEQPAAIVNAGNLTVKEGQSITLVGGLVINTGTITSPSGKITIAASADGKYVKITPEGSLLSLQLPIADQNQLAQSNVQAKDLPNLLTGSANLRNMTGLNTDASGNVLVANTAIPNTAGTAIASGNLNVSSTTAKGGEINVLGDRVGLVSANINASGAIGGGTVLIGGDYLGKGIVPNSQITVIDQSSTINADALLSGTGGKVIAWANDKTSFSGKISVRGGINGGNGGFVETSGKNYLNIQNASVDAAAPQGSIGSWLLDPLNIIVQIGGTATLADIANAADTVTTFTISPAIISAAVANVTFVASNDITFSDSVVMNNAGVGLTATAGRTLTLAAGADITTQDGAINFTAANMNINARLNTGGSGSPISLNATGDITIASQGSTFFDPAIVAGNVSIVTTNGNISTGSIQAITTSGSNVSLIANNGNITLDGYIQSGFVNNAASDSTITIRGNSFRAINPIQGPANIGNQQIPLSLVVFNANQQNNNPVTPLPRRIELTLPNDTQPRIVAGSAADPLSISIVILQDTSFKFSKITPTTFGVNSPVDSLLPTGSGIEGAISIGSTNIPPNVLVLVSDQSFSSNSGLANTLTATNTLSSDAIASARTADLQANASEVKECEPTGTKKPILNITASVPSATVTRTAQNQNRSNLPPCKE